MGTTVNVSSRDFQRLAKGGPIGKKKCVSSILVIDEKENKTYLVMKYVLLQTD